MKPVLHVIPSVAPRDGGPSAAIVGMCRALNQLGTPTLVATTDADGAGHLDVPLDRETEHAGIAVRFFKMNLSERFKYSRSLGQWLDAHVAEFSVVHVHAVFSHAPIVAGRACQQHGVPYVVRPLGTIDPWSLAHHARRKQVLMRLGARSLLAGAARVHYTADAEQQQAERGLPWLPQGVVIPLGVDEQLFALDPVDPARTYGPVVVVSRLDRKKGIDVLISAFHRVSDRSSSWRLVIAGDGEPGYVDHLRALAADGPGARHIEFKGPVGPAERNALLASASVFVLPSFQENFGLSIVEAMAAGAPVIVTPAVDIAHEIGAMRAGWVVERSVDGIAKALAACLFNYNDRTVRGRCARHLATKYRWTAVGAALQRLYAEILA
jgi:glycosyltransferase involved in cell wall biosynthesis